MPNVIKNFFNSEKAIAVGLLVIAASVLAGLGKMSISEWTSYTQTLAGIYVAGKSLQGGLGAFAASKANVSLASAAVADLAKTTDQIQSNDADADAAAAAKPE